MNLNHTCLSATSQRKDCWLTSKVPRTVPINSKPTPIDAIYVVAPALHPRHQNAKQAIKSRKPMWVQIAVVSLNSWNSLLSEQRRNWFGAGAMLQTKTFGSKNAQTANMQETCQNTYFVRISVRKNTPFVRKNYALCTQKYASCTGSGSAYQKYVLSTYFIRILDVSCTYSARSAEIQQISRSLPKASIPRSKASIRRCGHTCKTEMKPLQS